MQGFVGLIERDNYIGGRLMLVLDVALLFRAGFTNVKGR